MNKTDSLKLLDKYTDALKSKAEAEDKISKIDSEFRIKQSDFGVPFSKIFPTILGVFLVFALAIRIAFGSSLTFKNEMPITIGIFAGAVVLGFGVAKIVHLIVQSKARKNFKKAEESNNTAKAYRTLDYKVAIDKASYEIAEAESALPLSCRGLDAAKAAKNKLLSGKANTLEEATGGFTAADWEDAYTATPKVYEKPGDTVFGAFAITEATRTILPKDPKKKFASEAEKISEWKMVLVSLTQDCVLGDCDFYNAISKFDKFILDSNEDSILIRGLTEKELAKLVENKAE